MTINNKKKHSYEIKIAVFFCVDKIGFMCYNVDIVAEVLKCLQMKDKK